MYVNERSNIIPSIHKWSEYEDGMLMKVVLGKALSGATVKRADLVDIAVPANNSAGAGSISNQNAPCLTYGSFEGE